MRDIPIVFPIALAIIVAMLLFTSAYAVSANAVANNPSYGTQVSSTGFVIPTGQAAPRQTAPKTIAGTSRPHSPFDRSTDSGAVGL